MNFQRGIDPRRAMKIGIVTWNNLGLGCQLKCKHDAPMTQINTIYLDLPSCQQTGNAIQNVYTYFKFAVDNAKPNMHLLRDHIFNIIEYDNQKGIITTKVVLTTGMLGTAVAGRFLLSDRSSREFIIKGPIERFRKYFEIIQ